MNFATGHLQHPAPTTPPWLFREVFAPAGVPELTTVLGPGAYCGMYTGNTNLPGSLEQPVHVDDGQLWVGTTQAPPAHALLVNVFLHDVDDRNGPTEVWPGTHRDVRITRYSRSALVVDELGRVAEPTEAGVLLCGPAGTVCIRDVRLWHRARSNTTDCPRTLVTTLFFAPWYAGPSLRLPQAAAPFVNGLPVAIRAEFDETYADHLRGVAGFDGTGRRAASD